VFGRTWQMIAHESELAAEDSFLVRRLGGDSVIVTRAGDDLRVLVNSCAHRGNQLCKAAAGTAKRFTCGYHGWTYENDGRLVGVPRVKVVYGEDFDRGDFELPQARVEVYRGLVFASWDDTAPSIAAYLGDAAWYLDTVFSLTEADWEVYGPPLRYRHGGNWKLESENFGGDGYHLPTTHASMYSTGVMGRDLNTEFSALGHVVAMPEGHCLRAVHLDMPDPKPYIGLPESLWPSFDARFSPEQQQLMKANTVLHGCIFPNLSWIKVALGSTGEADDEWTCYVMFRSSLPVDARTTEVTQWLLVPEDFPEDWKARAYRFMIRSHAPAAPFEGDDLENFNRIATVGGGPTALEHPFDYSLGLGAESQENGWPGPGIVLSQNQSEHGQRAMYRRYLEMMRDK
jgi:phenylpropionate dioxygenase-like ring-hydroxylating dioxygenase large terminal subunit